MTVPLSTGFLYAVAPAIAGYIAAVILMSPLMASARQAPHLRGPFSVLMVLPATGVVFSVVCTMLASWDSTGAADLGWPLVAVGAAAAVSAIAQGLVARTGFQRVVAQQAMYGKLLVRMVLPEVLILLAFAFFMLRLPAHA